VSGGLSLAPIGVVRTPFAEGAGTPIQPAFAAGAEGRVELDPDWAPALQDLEGFERVWLLVWLHRARPPRLRVVPYRDTVERGLFATRAPSRPNPIGLSCVRLLGVEGSTLRVADVDLLDGTPVLDVKPYVPEFDAYPAARAGWLEGEGSGRTHADARFHGRGPAEEA